MLRFLEKGLYIIGVPSLLAGCGYKVYHAQKEKAEGKRINKAAVSNSV